MAAIWSTTCMAWALVAAPVLVAEPSANPPSAPRGEIVDTRFVLADGTISPAAALQASSRALTRERAKQARVAKGGAQFSNITVGPSWSYQSPRSGALIEMGALGGGVVADRPRLAHVALAWQF